MPSLTVMKPGDDVGDRKGTESGELGSRSRWALESLGDLEILIHISYTLPFPHPRQ